MAEELVVGGRFDPQGIESGAQRGAEAIERFGARTRESLRQPVRSAEEVAQAMTALGVAARALASGRGIVVDAGNLEQARQIVSRLNGDLTVMQALTDAEREKMQELGAAMARDVTDGLRTARREQEQLGAAMARDVERQIAAQERLGAAAATGGAGMRQLTTNALGFNAASSRLANGAIAASFGIATLARSSENAEPAVQSILRAVSVAALALGPEGILVGATLAAGDAIFNILDRERREMEKTEKAFLESLNRMRDAADLHGLARLQEQLFSGKTTIDAAGRLVRTEGVQQLRAQLDAVQQQIATLNATPLAVPGTAHFDIQENERRQQTLAALNARADALRSRLAPLEQQYGAAVAATNEALGTAVDRETTRIKLAADSRTALRGLADAQRALLDDAEHAVTAYERLKKAGFDTRDATVEIARQMDRLAAALVQQKDPFSGAAEQLRKELDKLAATGLDVPVRLQITTGPSRIPTVGATPQAAVPAIVVPESALRRAADDAGLVASHFEHALTDAQQIVDAFGTLPGTLQTVSTALASAVQLTQGIQGATASGAGTLQVLTGLSSAIGGAVGIVGAVGTLSAAMFGQTQAQREATAALHQARDATDRLRASLDAGTGTAGRAGDVERAVAEVIARGTFDGNALQEQRKEANQELLTILKQNGLTFQQLQAQAQQFGISLLDSNGNLIQSTDLFRQFNDLLQLSNANLFTFSGTLSDQQKLAETRDKLLGKTSPADEIARELDLFAKNAAGALAHTFDGFDPNTAAGRAAIHQGLLNVFAKIQAGTLKPEDLPGFHSLDDLLQILTTVNGDLDQLGDATRKATDAMLNVPTGFRIALATFNAQDPTQIGSGATIPVESPDTRTPDSHPWRRHTTGGDTVSNAWTFHIGTVTTQAKSGAEFLDELLAAAGQRARSSSGDAAWMLRTIARAN